MQYIFEKLCYYSGREKVNKNGEKLKEKDLIEKEDKENSTKKIELFECHCCFLPLEKETVKQIVKLQNKTFWFCSADCYKGFLQNPTILSWNNHIYHYKN
jgi:YHS domain-containing protein